MSNTSIYTENLSKQYRIGAKQEGYKSLRESLVSGFSNPIRQVGELFRGRSKGAKKLRPTMWALRDVSIEIKHGETVGIIGRNGSGKSTLLKIVSSITEPTMGFARVTGRVGSLLEVGTGFHPELTGRENVYLNGAILGMSKKEIDKKFDEIVHFAELDEFIDTPVKHYSSGMHARLAFAVAAHLEPEILVVDEVLAVGDSRFQRRCLNKMEDVGQSGRTVLFVSHNMASITRLCQRAILLDGGRVVDDGPAHQVVGSYMTGGMGTTAVREWPDLETAPGMDIVKLRSARVRSQDGAVSEMFDIRKSIGLEMEIDVLRPGCVLLPHFNVYNDEGTLIFPTLDMDPEWRQRPRPAGRYVCTAWIPENFLSEGTVFVDPAMVTLFPYTTQFWEKSALSFQVVDAMDGTSARGDWAGHLAGAVRPKLKWTTRFEPADSKPIV